MERKERGGPIRCPMFDGPLGLVPMHPVFATGVILLWPWRRSWVQMAAGGHAYVEVGGTGLP